jgi:uncharacterized protein (TIGR00299 family) protein
MRIAHFDCFSGISGDMTLGALIDAGVDALAIRDGIASLGLPVQMVVDKVRKAGFAATAVRILAQDSQQHRHLADIERILQQGSLTKSQLELAQRIFRRLAEAEAQVHGLPIDGVHFHEVGALDSIADIVGAAIGLDLLAVDQYTSRPVPTGGGMVQCAHGLMPVPAPGTLELLRGVPLAASPVQSELTTPTGAAILTTVVGKWIEQPVMTVERVGHGAGSRDFSEQPNLLRLLVGTATAATAASDQVWILETNLDDLSAEIIGYCYDQLFKAGAVEVFSTPIFMKKNRPGVQLSVLAPPEALVAVEEVLFRETSTFGIRRSLASRHKLKRQVCKVSTPWGEISGKVGWIGDRPSIFSPEYEDCARLAREHQLPLRDVYQAAHEAYKLSAATRGVH